MIDRRPLVVHAIAALAHGAHVDVPRSAIDASSPPMSIAPTLAAIGARVGLRVRPVDAPLAALARGEADDVFPLVSIEGERCIAVMARKRRRFVVRIDDEPATTMTKAGLAALLAVADDAPVAWFTAERKDALGRGHGVSALKRVGSLVKLERDDIGVVVVYSAGVGVLALATPLGVQFLVNTVAFGALLQPLVVLTALVLVGLAFESLLQALKTWVIERIQQRVFVRVALDVADRLPRVRREALASERGPEVVNRFFDVVTLQKGAADLLAEGIAVVLAAVVGMLILAFYHPILLAFDVVLVVGIAFVVFGLGRRGVATSIDESAAKFDVAGWLEEVAAHHDTFALGEGPRFVTDKAEALTRSWLDRRRAHFRIVFRQSTGALVLRALASAALLGIGGWLVLSRQLSLGQLVAAELVVSTVVAGFAKFGKVFDSTYDLVAAADKVGHLLDLEVVDDAARASARDPQGLAITARAEVQLHLAPGSRTVVHGPGRSGKSRLVDTLAGLRRLGPGECFVDGHPLDDVPLSTLHADVAIVREPEIFEGSVLENVSLGRPDVDRRAVREALRSLGIEDVIAALPDGLDTRLPHPALPRTGSAALLLVVARTLVGRARLVLVDGALDRLDETDQRSVWRALGGRPWTVLLTTSRRELLGLTETAYELGPSGLVRASRGSTRISRSPMRASGDEA